MKRRSFVAGTAAGMAAPALAGARAVGAALEWSMVTSWPRNFPGPGTGARRLAERISAMSAGRLTIKVYGAGELVPALEVLDAVSGGVAQMGHTASFFWRGKIPASVFFTTVPFGLTAGEHAAWIYHGGGQPLWDGLYAPLGVTPFMAGNSGMQMGGWFTRELTGLDSLAGLKYRIPGLGGEVMRKLGVTPVLLAPPQILPALQSGAVDGAEFLGPWSDLASGFYKVAPYYYWPGFHEPNGTAELLVNTDAWGTLAEDLKAIVRNACEAENSVALAETEWNNALSLRTLTEKHGVITRRFPQEVLDAAREATGEVLAELVARDADAARVYASFERAKTQSMTWTGVSTEAFLVARRGG